MVGLQTLDLAIGVRVPASQLSIEGKSRTSVRLFSFPLSHLLSAARMAASAFSSKA